MSAPAIPAFTEFGPAQLEIARGRIRRRIRRLVFTHPEGLRIVGQVTRRQRTLCERNGHRDPARTRGLGALTGTAYIKRPPGPWMRYLVHCCPRCLAPLDGYVEQVGP